MKRIKEFYVPPQSETLELRIEGIIALSDPEYQNPFGDQQGL